MRRIGIIALAVGALVASIAAVVPAEAPSDAESHTVMGHVHPAPDGVEVSEELAAQLADARFATQRYAFNLKRAKRDGYFIITRHIPDMGYHFLNPAIAEFDVTQPPILVYVKRDGNWQLGAFEWVFTETPAEPPLEGATYGSFGAACHYVDGTFVFVAAEADCPETSPETGSPFRFWHPDLVTLHVWLWYPNPDGLYAGTNPLVSPFNEV